MAEKSLEAHFIKCLKEGNTKKALYIIKLLGDDVNKIYKRKSLLLWAKEFENDEVARVLEEKRAVEEVISDEEAKKLGIQLVEKTRDGDLDAVIELIEKGAYVNMEKGFGGHTVLMMASENGHLEIVEKLIEAGADVNAKDRLNNTALIKASKKGGVEVIKALLDAGAKVDEKDKFSQTALMWASWCGCLDVVKALLSRGAKVDEKAIDYTSDDEIKKMLRKALIKQKEKQNEKTFINKISGLFGRE